MELSDLALAALINIFFTSVVSDRSTAAVAAAAGMSL